MKAGDRASAQLVRKFLTYDDDRHPKLARQEQLRAGLEQREGGEPPRDPRQQSEEPIAQNRHRDDRFAPDAVRTGDHHKRHHRAETHDRRDDADCLVAQVKRRGNVGSAEMENSYVIAFEDRRWDEQTKQLP